MSIAPLEEPWIEELLEEVGLVHCAPATLLKGRGGVRNAEVALARRTAYWVLRRRGVSVERIAALFTRPRPTILKGLRTIDRDLVGPNPPEWSVDIYPLAGITFHDLLRWAIRDLALGVQEDILAFCHGALNGEPGRPIINQLCGLRVLAYRPRIRKRVRWAYQSMGEKDPSYSIQWQSESLGYPYVS